ncbi:MAG: methyltransferase domain-containing protein [Sphingomonadales bacterium]|nr:methyltransferase domain-containing protein [Sphingomonadales bacterium]
MTAPAPPRVFHPARRLAQRRRADALSARPDTARYLLDDMAEDVIERLSFLRHQPARALVIGDRHQALSEALTAQGCAVTHVDAVSGWDEERPYPQGNFNLIASLGVLDTLNDPVGALIHIRNALAPGGLALASFSGAGSLPTLRAAMLEADGDRPAPRLHPMIDVRAGAQLLQRAGWVNPVVDNRSLSVRFSSLASLVADLRAQAQGNCLARPGPPLTRVQRDVASEAFGSGRVETFEILTLTGWRS